MKIKLLLISILLLFYSGHLWAGWPGQGITLSLRDADFTMLIRLIEKQTPYRFIYNSEQVALASKISIQVKDASITEVLEISFRNQPLQYVIDSTIIIISPKPLTFPVVQRKAFTVEGRVTNDLQEPLAGVSVTVTQTQQGTSTDVNGKYVLRDLDPEAKLRFSNIGYLSQEIDLKGRQYLNVSLVQVVNNLDESVVIGYGNTTKRLNTGSVGKVNAKMIEQQPVSNMLAAMQGRVAGLNIIQNTGVPGGSFTVQIRGRNSIAGGNDPLYIIDGVPVISQPQGSEYSSSSTDYGNPLSSYNPLDIESIEVLKDADATAIYGSRAANGVVLVTTKKGKSGKLKIDANIRYGFGEVARRVELLNTPDYLKMRREAFKNDGITPSIFNAPDLLKWDSTKNIDWQDKLIGGHAEQLNSQLSLSGGNENLRFLLSGNYYAENTVFPGDFRYKRINGHYNFGYQSPDKRFSFSLTGGYGMEDNRLPVTTHSYLALQPPPNAPESFNNDGSLYWEPRFLNPYQPYKQSITTNTDNVLNNISVSYIFLQSLEFKLNAGFNQIKINEVRLLPKSSYDPSSSFSNAESSFADRQIHSWITEPQLLFRKSFDKMNLEILAGMSFQEMTRKGTTLYATGFSSDFVLPNIAAASSITVMENMRTKYRYNGTFARVSYGYKNTYLINLNYRRDGSSRFGSDHQYANFASAGLAWIFSKEHFLKNLKFISFGKLRTSYGSAGNDQIGDYQYLDSWVPAQNPYQGVQGFIPARLANPDYRWELNKRFEGALELGLFKNIIYITAAYYSNISTNQLVGYSLPSITGFISIQQNLPAKISNTGWEFELTSSNMNKPNFKWSSSFNLTIPKNKLVSYPGIESSAYANTYVVGEPLSVQKNFNFLGANPLTGIYSFEDLNKDGVISSPADRQQLKFVGQKLYGGFANSIKIKRFELDLFFYGAIQEGRKLKTSFQLPCRMYNQPTEVLSRWQKPGDISDIQKFTQGFGPGFLANLNNNFNGDNITNTSYLKLKNLLVAYVFPLGKNGRTQHSTMKIYLEGQNIFVLTKFAGFDPEFKDLALLPNLRIFAAGIQFRF